MLFGAPLFRLAISAHGPARGWPGGRALGLATAIVALLSALGWFVGEAAGIVGSWADALAPDMLKAVAFDTRFGHVSMGRVGALVVVAAIHAWMKPARAKDIALLALAGAATAGLVGGGHGLAGEGAVGSLHAAADMTHALCAMGWIGGLFCLGQVLGRAAVGDLAADDLRVVLPRFSRVGYWLVALLLISGCINALVLVPR